MDVTGIGKRIALYRKTNGMKQTFLAKRIGVSRQALYMWEKGLQTPSTQNIVKIAKALNCSTDEIF